MHSNDVKNKRTVKIEPEQVKVYATKVTLINKL